MIRLKIKHYDYGALVNTELYEFRTGVFFVFKDAELQGFEMLIDDANLKDVCNFGSEIIKLMDHGYKVAANLLDYQTISCEFVGDNDRLIKHININGVLIFLDSDNYLNINYYVKDGNLMSDVIKRLDDVCKVLYSLIVNHLANKLSL